MADCNAGKVSTTNFRKENIDFDAIEPRGLIEFGGDFTGCAEMAKYCRSKIPP